MKSNIQHGCKEDFQLERIAFFSDAVFAIAITILIIEIRVPGTSHEHYSNGMLWNKLFELIPKIIGVVISFFVIGLYWMSHHRLFGYLVRYSPKLLWPNMLFLLTIIFMPFSTAFLSEYYSPALSMPVVLYTININLTGIMSYKLWSVATKEAYNLSSISHNKVVKDYNRVRAMAIPLTFLLVMLLSFVSGWIPFVVLPFMPVISMFIKRYFKKKYPQQIESHLG